MSKIEWTDLTFNPVWGCNSKECDYCYARGIAKRFASEIAEKEVKVYAKQTTVPIGTEPNFDLEIEHLYNEIKNDIADFKPTFLQSNYDNFKPPKTPKKIFVGSMSDIAFWTDEWILKLIDKINDYPQHTFQLLTKFPKVYTRKVFALMPKNVWYGVTVTSQNDMHKLRTLQAVKQGSRKIYVSFEPLLTEIKNEYLLRTKGNEYPFRKLGHKYRTTLYDNLDWIIIGTMSGKNRTPAKLQWIKKIVDNATNYNVPIFIKQLELNGKLEKDIDKFPENLRLRQFPS